MLLALLAISAAPDPLNAQTTAPMITGEFFLKGVMEMASGFRFNPDSTFDFFYIYGSLDRVGHGTWVKKGEYLILNSPPKPEQDFILQEAKHTDADQLVIQITDPNEMILPYVLCKLITAQGELNGTANSSGIIAFGKVPVTEIWLLHELWPDRPSIFKNTDPANNYFSFTIAPWIVNVSFKDLKLHIVDKDTLVGMHPLMERTNLQYGR
jgi:hypothetical protein